MQMRHWRFRSVCASMVCMAQVEWALTHTHTMAVSDPSEDRLPKKSHLEVQHSGVSVSSGSVSCWPSYQSSHFQSLLMAYLNASMVSL